MINQYANVENNNSVIKQTHTRIKLIRTHLGGDRSMSGKYFTKSSMCIKDSEKPFSLALILIVSPKILPKLGNFLHFAHITLQYGHKLLLMSNLFWPDKSVPSTSIFSKSFLTSKTCWQSFHCENLTMTVVFFLLILWQASVCSVEILHPSFSKMFTTLVQGICFHFIGNAYYV